MDCLQSTLRKRIAVIVPKYGLVGGAEGFVAELTSRLVRTTPYDIEVFANKWLKDEKIHYHKIPFLSFPRFLITISFAYIAERKIKRLSSQAPFELVHAHDRVFHADLFTMHSVPHRFWVKEVRKKRRMSLFDIATAWVERKLVKSGTCRFAAVSELTKEKFLQEYPNVPSDAISVIHPGIDPQAYAGLDRAAARSEIRNLHGIGENDFVLLFVSMNFDIKGLDFVFNGLSKIHSLMPERQWTLLIAGKDNLVKYDRLAQSLGIRDRIIFAGIINRDTLKQYYLSSDAFIMPSRFDTFGLTVLEAMAAGLPAIVSRNVGARDVIEQGVNGFIVKNPALPSEIADAILSVMDDDARTRMGEAARKTAEHYTWDSTAQKTAQLYEAIIAAHETPEK